MGLIVHRAQSRHGDVGVQLGGREAGVSEQFLHDAQIGAALGEMGGYRVTQPVRAQVRRAGDRGQDVVDDRPRLPLIQPLSPFARRRACPELSVATVGRPMCNQRSIASAAGFPYGTERSLSPLPITRRRRRSRSTEPRSRPHSSPTRIPVA